MAVGFEIGGNDSMGTVGIAEMVGIAGIAGIVVVATTVVAAAARAATVVAAMIMARAVMTVAVTVIGHRATMAPMMTAMFRHFCGATIKSLPA